MDNDFKLAESIAIYRYLASEHKIADNWYPKDSKKRAKVDEYLEWQHVRHGDLMVPVFNGNGNQILTFTNFLRLF